MTVKKAILISVFLVFIMLLSPLTPVVNAYSNLYTLLQGNIINPELKVIRAISNKYVYATMDYYVVKGFNVTIFSSMGVYITSTRRTAIQVKADLGAIDMLTTDISLFNIDSTYVGLILGGVTYSSPNYYGTIAYYKLNIDTGVLTYVAKSNSVGTTHVYSELFLSNILSAGSNFFLGANICEPAKSFICMYKLTSSAITSATYLESTADGVIAHKIVIGYDNIGCIYVLTSSKANDTPRIYQFIISTSAFATVGESSMSGIWVDKASTLLRNIKFAGFEYIPYEDYYYLSFNYVYCWVSGSNIYYRCFSFRMIYNETVSLPTLLAQNHRYYDVVPHGYSSTVGLMVGKLYFRSDYDRFTFYYQRIDEGVYKWTKDQITIPDYYSLTSEAMYRDDDEYVQDITIIGEEIPIDTLYFGAEQIVRQPEQNVQFNLYSWVNGGKVYGVSPLQTSYDLTFSLSPDVQPLLLNTPYEFTVMAYQGGGAYSGMLYIYANNVIILQQETDIAGKIEFTKTFTVGGYYNLTAKIMVVGSSVYEESHLYTVSFTEGGGGTEEEVAGGNLQQVMNYLIPSIALLFPVGIGIGALRNAPEIGLMVGLTIGGVIAVWSQLVPMYVLIIIVIIDLLIILYGRGSGGNNGL